MKFNLDITFCSDRCDTLECKRNYRKVEQARLSGKYPEWEWVSWDSFAEGCKDYFPEGDEPEAA